ncbi:hypothetical protein HAX54_046712 [Datura stramonium]|uniref:Uncharacterized protein n=1 Tax=Datura stramonium TaxID=4076 RepID=A0ABS8WHF7_DATST|nr:hypothetical protein [Datura stramonium]
MVIGKMKEMGGEEAICGEEKKGERERRIAALATPEKKNRNEGEEERGRIKQDEGLRLILGLMGRIAGQSYYAP